MNRLPLSDFIKKGQTVPVIDVRSPDEYDQGHIPGSINVPILNNEQRAEVGTIYKQEGQQNAILKGFQLAGPDFESKARTLLSLAGEGEILIHCWRGGMRSEIMAWIAKISGIKAYVLDGGYKVFRAHVLDILSKPVEGVVISGATGSGKTEILQHLAGLGYPVIDLEEAAQHKGSSFGAIGKQHRTQEMFENILATTIEPWPENTAFVLEDESRMIGRKCIPEAWFNAMQNMPFISLQVSLEQRIERIRSEYAVLDTDELKEAILRLEKRLGNQRMKEAILALEEGRHNDWIALMLEYYDKSYHHLKLKRSQPGIPITFDWQNPEKGYQTIIKELNQRNIYGTTSTYHL